MNIKEIKFLMERIESNKRLTDTEYQQKHQDLLKEEELKTGEGYYCALPIDNTGKNRVYVKVKFLGKNKDGGLVVTPLEEVRFMTDGRTNSFGEGKQFNTSMEFMLTKNFGPMKEYHQKHQDLLKESSWFRAIHKDDGIDIEEFYNYSQKPDPKTAEKFKGKFLHLDDLIRTKEGMELLANPKLDDAIKKLGIKIEMRKTEIDHPQILAKIIKTLVKPGILNFDELVKTPNINKGLKDNSNWTQEVLNKVAPREGMEVGDLSSYAQRLVAGK